MGGESILTGKGQTTIPKSIRAALGLKAGDRITFTMLPDGTVRMRAKNKSALNLAGMFRKKRQRRLSTDLLSR